MTQIVSPEEEKAALDIARAMIRAGIPVFAAPPTGPGTYQLPNHWPKTVPSETWLDEKYQTGWALAALGGIRAGCAGADFLDVDPRSGGASSLAEVQAAGHMPQTFGRQATPSGGDHYVLAPTGERKATGFMPGLDLQSGAEDGEGRGFVWIAPTVRRSKDPADEGALRAYRWVEPPDLEGLDEWSGAGRDLAQGIIDRIAAKRSAPRERPAATAAPVVDAHAVADPFLDAGMPGWSHAGTDRAFTQIEAQDFVRPALTELAKAPIGQIEERCNTAAATLFHFVPTFWTPDEAYRLLTSALGQTAYDPNGPSDWKADKFRPVLDGRRAPLDPWKATRREVAAAPPSATMEAGPGEESLGTYEKLHRRLISAADLAELPDPEPLIDGLLNLDADSWIIGAPGTFKSFIALDMAGHVANGRPWHGRDVTQGQVLYIAAEGARGMTRRVRAWIKRHGAMDGVTFLPYPVLVESQDRQWDSLIRIASELKPVFIVIDTQSRVTAGLEENSAKDMNIFIRAVGSLRRASGACVLVVHHTGRNGTDARGSSAIDGAQDTELKVIRAEPRNTLACKIVMDKQKDMAEIDSSEGIPVFMGVQELGKDARGRDISSLVVLDGVESAMRAEEVEAERRIDLTPWAGRHPEAWIRKAEGITVNATVQHRIVQCLLDHAHSRGLTQSETRRVVTERWYTKGRGPDGDSWTDAWNRVTSSPLAVGMGGQRWGLDLAMVAGLRAEYGED